MRSVIDLTGQIFGTLKVIEINKNYKPSDKKHIYYICKCNCGNVITATEDNLKSGNTQSCGCSRINNIIGQKFGRLTVLEPTKRRADNNGDVVWLCKCDCGNITNVRTTHLKSGHIKSCGCYNVETSKIIYDEHLKPFEFQETNLLRLNQKVRKDSGTQVKGIYWNSKRNKYEAHITFKRKQYHLGRFDNLEDAIKARQTAEEKLFQPIIEEYNRQKEE